MNTKMKAVVAAVLVTAGASASAVTVSYSTTCAAGDGSGLTTCVAGATVTTFDGGAGLPAGYSGNGQVVTGFSSGVYAAPLGDGTRYLSVPANGSSGTVTRTLAGSYNYFGLYWGSMDSYNTLAFYSGNALVTSVTGSDVIATLNLLGNQTNPGSNRYVDFYFGNQSFDRIDFASNGYAFESDNHAVANVPEPATLGLLGLGLLGAGVARRHRNRG